MKLKYNPLSGQFDFVNPTASSSLAKHDQSFNATTDWTVDGAIYKIIITEATHGAGVNPTFQVFEIVGADSIEIFPSVTYNVSGDITLSVTSSPDNRFAGKIIIF